jgi:GST-like protein
MEVKRQLDVLDKHLENNQYICGDEYTIADIAIWPWYGALMLNRLYDAAEFLNVTSYKNLMRWAKEIDSRPAVKRGVMVNKTWGELSTQLHERHEASDFINKTQDKLTDDK